MEEKLDYGKRNYVLMILFSLFRFGGDSFFYSFLTRYFKILNETQNFGDIRLGVLIALVQFMAVIGNIVISKFTGSFLKRRIVLIVLAIIETTFIMCFGFSTSFAYILIADILCNFCSNAFYNLWDTFILPITSKVHKTYASGRLFGTFSYLIGVLAGGFVISGIGYKYDFVIAGALMLFATVFFLLMKFTKEEVENFDREEDVTAPATYKDVFKNKGFVVYFIALAFLIGNIWAADNTFSQYTVVLNISNEEYGYAYALAIVGEGVMLVLISSIKKLNNYKIMMVLAAISQTVRTIIFAVPGLNNTVYIVAEIFRGITYGLVLASNLNLVKEILGPHLLVKGFFVLVALDELVAGVSNLLVPSLISAVKNASGSEIMGYTVCFTISTIFTAVSLVMLTLLFHARKKAADLKPAA